MNKQQGFTLIELLVVISVISVVASLVLSSVNSAREKAKIARAQMDFKNIELLVVQAQLNANQTLQQITGSGCSRCQCDYQNQIEPLATDVSCTNQWEFSINAIAVAAGEDASVAEPYYRDPWGNPYLLDENEGEGGNWCRIDKLSSSQGSPTWTEPLYLLLPQSFDRC